MPKKGSSNLGRLTKDAKDKRKNREDVDYAAVEREKHNKRMAVRREDEEFREQRRLETADYRKTKAKSEAKSGRQRDDMIARKQAEEAQAAARVKENLAKLY